MSRETIDECRRLLREADGDALAALIVTFARDDRAGVRDLAASAKRRVARASAEHARLAALQTMQRELLERGYRLVAGVDEVGRGALAGPVTACAVVLPDDAWIDRLDDSKRLVPEVRADVAASVRSVAIAVCVAHAESEEIDRIGIGGATRMAMDRAIDGLDIAVDHVLVDGNDERIAHACTPVIGGDGKVGCIAAASVVAKVARDALMVEISSQHPGYLLHVNKGYSTAEHLAALRELGPSPIHRRSFAPCMDVRPLF